MPVLLNHGQIKKIGRGLLMFKKILLVTFLLLTNILHAAEISITVAPIDASLVQAAQSGGFKPVINEPFLVVFSIPYKGDQAPDYPEFTPQGLEVQRRYGSANTFSIGPRGSEKKTVYSYVVSATDSGTAWLKNISIMVDGKNRKLPGKAIQILAEKPKSKDVFVVAEVDKDKLYVGQGFNVVYYLYYNRTKVAVDDLRRAKDPSFANIIKRFNQPGSNSAGEMVNIDGVPFHRIQVYSVRAFAENPGTVDLGPMTVEVAYRTSNFGPSYSKKISSQRVKLNILALPGDIPKNFTGLVGVHQFEVVNSRTRFLVNEPIEFTVRVTGEGALEKFNLQPLLNHPELESFDTQSELELDPSQVKGTKKFDVTYLARAAIKLPASEVSWSYFDPETEKYVEVKHMLPEMTVAGASSKSVSESDPISNEGSEDKAPVEVKPSIDQKSILSGVIAPDFVALPPIQDYWRYLNIALGAASLLVFLLGWYARPREYKIDPQIQKMINTIKKEGFNYSRLHHLLLFVAKDPHSTLSLKQIVEQSDLMVESKNYFLQAINQIEKSNFGDGQESSISYKHEHFKNLLDLLKK